MSCHVLVVEDNPDVRAAYRKLLRMEGHRVSVATDGREGLATLEASEDVGLILLDLLVPGVDGWAFRERQMERGIKPEVPLVLMSAVSGDLRAEADALDAVTAVRKPIGPDQLRNLVDEYGRVDD